MEKVKDREYLNQQETVIYIRVPIRLSDYFSTKTFQARKGLHKIFKVKRKQGSTNKTTLLSKAVV